VKGNEGWTIRLPVGGRITKDLQQTYGVRHLEIEFNLKAPDPSSSILVVLARFLEAYPQGNTVYALKHTEIGICIIHSAFPPPG
jgi:hypothetical protein